MAGGSRSLTLTLTLVLCGVFTYGSVAALDWPVRKAVLTATFGENRWDHFHDGIDIGGGEQNIHPSADGQVVFTYDEGNDARDLPTGLGSFMVIQHGQDVRTLYAHMKRGSVLENKTSVTTADVIGVVGDTGDSVGRHLHFEVIDRAKGEIINPLTLLPQLSDTVSPVIKSVSIERNNKITTLRPAMTVAGGQAALLVDVYDPSQYVEYFDPMAPYEIEATLNGSELFNITYDALKDTNGTAYLASSDHRSFDDYYVDTWTVRLGEFPLATGQAHLTVTARDIEGNQTSRTFTLAVLGTNSQ